MTDLKRLDKRLQAQIACSRREAEIYITGGWVRVDGEVVEETQAKVAEEQSIALDAQAELVQLPPASLMLNKPAGLDSADAVQLITLEHRSAEDVGTRVLKRHFRHLLPVMPLESAASGLLILSQDRGFAAHMHEQRDRYEQEFAVEVLGTLSDEQRLQMERGRGLNEKAPSAIKVSWQSEARLRIAAKAAQPGQISRLCETAGLQVVSLKRLRVGRIPLSRLAPGEWRYLAAHERF